MAGFDVQGLLDRGVSKVKDTVSAVSVEQRGFVKAFVRLCTDGWEQGWHERNGGNASYRLTSEEVSACRPFFAGDEGAPRPWEPLGVTVPSLAGEHFLVTGAGSFMRNIALDPAANLGIVEVDATGSAYRVVWGLGAAGRPTSELAGHLMVHAVKKATTGGACRVLYHCHPANVVALGCALPPISRDVTRTLWKAMTECIMVFPEGIGVVPVLTPGSRALAEATANLMERHNAVIWAHHGLMTSGATFDEAFGLAHVVVKAAAIYESACAMCGGAQFACAVTDEQLRQIAADLGVHPNPDYL